ncbi:mediator of RNA polymerase II transcription subunit 25-like [Lotus japonicus]|uniref:mediator of RNA polymerase II transcription subunit 25-like n=1 Tax=Lotus japonicus TaxID=34305 RepID=UPI002589D7A9|nr:mediator of RNA polymerase II transcription subunit 25-like [Lotus japonicus]XP_057446960.1 mediator of RNA polymerase II transcription subunit 25-like [Lotus japonicus]XP_057446961.1 mediator of RNA polymerase II transcription subunit 25-like [Lotus japonicus]XP_057446962.1 mediator of RNA polymerase II transcription subunit 25-like [Lotus japonicus]XP_057446963.1 mediator of RNA polymerase II transcription subunit 25-like [Lotus japonicus]XP_057446964.1 mediator of RNA polymerase II trans
MAEKQLVVAVECTAAMGPYWDTILRDYLDKIIRSFGGNESIGQNPSASNVEFALVTYSTHGCYSGCLVQRTGWTRDPNVFFSWLSAVPFTGGGFNDAAIAEGLAEALMMFPNSQSGGPNQQNVDMHKHCILVAASNPYPLKTPVYIPRPQNLEKIETIDSDPGNRLYDAEAVAKEFPQFSISLSVICPRQLPKVKAIYNAGKRTSGAADPPVDVKTPYFLVLISEAFREASTALSRSGITILPTKQSPVKVDAVSVTPGTWAPPTSLPSVNGSIANWKPISVRNVAPATVKVGPVPVASMVSGPAFPHNSSVPRAASSSPGVPNFQTSSPSSASQDLMTSTENGQDTKPMASMLQPPLGPVHPAQVNVNSWNNLSQAPQVMNSAALSGGTSMGLPSMGQTPVAMHMSNMISSGMASSVPAAQNAFSSGPSGIISITSSGPLIAPAQVGQNSALCSLTLATSNLSSSSNLGISQPLSNLQGAVSMGQRVPGMSQGNISGAQVVQGRVTMNQNVGPSVVSSGNGTMIPTPGMSLQVQSGVQPLGNNAAPKMTLPQQTSGGMQPTQSKYIKIWEGSLCGIKQEQPVFITKLEGYRNVSAPETIAENWPPVMQMVRLIPQDHMNDEHFVGKADFVVFRVMNPHRFFGQLQEKKLCAVIPLPSQTLLLSISNKASRLIGMLLPGILDMAALKPQLSSQQQQQMQQPQQMQSQQQQHPHLQQQKLPQQQQQQQQLTQLQQQQQQLLPQVQHQQLSQLQQQQLPQLQQQQLSLLQPQQQLPQLQQLQHQQLPQQQEMVGAGIGQAYVQGPGQSQMVYEGQVSQGTTDIGGGS